MTISELENRIRRLITSNRQQSILLKDPAQWNKLCSSLDVIEDTQLAIEAYPKHCKVQGVGESYLIIYGILQTLLLQQDAAKHIGDAIGIRDKLPKALEEIRVIRNSAAGHPGYQKENRFSKSSFITRISILPTSFQLITVYSGNHNNKIKDIEIPNLVKEQEIYIHKILEKFVNGLEKQEIKHRRMHKSKKIADIFPPTISYHLEKIDEAIFREERFYLGIPNLKEVSDCVNNFKDELCKRGEWSKESDTYDYNLIIYALNCLNAYFEDNNEMNSQDAYIFIDFIRRKLNFLRETAKELDKKYASEI